MSIEKTIECQYGHHMCTKDEFTPSGLNNKYNICRQCNAEKMKKYRQKHKKEYNEKVREYQRDYKRKIRRFNKNEIEV